MRRSSKMKRRNKIIATAALGASAAAIWAGVLVTSNAIASETPSDKVSVTLLAASPDGDGAISCQFSGVTMVSTSGSGAISVSGSATALPEGSAQADVQVISGTGTIEDPDGLLEDSGTLIGEASGDLQVLPVPGGEVRPGTPEECAALRPESVPAP
jgi:hypothetical protein